jgi:hypothetical protein
MIMEKIMKYFIQVNAILLSIFLVDQFVWAQVHTNSKQSEFAELVEKFQNPPDSARPGVYWYFMDGNLSREEMTADLESMKEAGIGSVLFLEVNVEVPRGPVNFMSEQWQDLFAHAVREAQRLGIEIILGTGPGWAGSGGPWVKPEQSMQHLTASSIKVKGPLRFHEKLPIAPPRKPFFDTITKELQEQRDGYYEDVAVLAYPTPEVDVKIEDIDEKALYYRAPFSSAEGVKPYLATKAEYSAMPKPACVDKDEIRNLTARLKSDGTLDWEVPDGNWTIMRFVSRNNGANTRPAPQPGYGFECDKFSKEAFDDHFNHYIGKLLKKIGPRQGDAGLTMLHIDSWEMGTQNWTQNFRKEFCKRRGYDPQPFYPAYTGLVVGSLELTERFLWDLRLTGQELLLENHAQHVKSLGRKYGLGLSIEPYDMNPTADLDLGAVADIPMCEFWSPGGLNTSFSCIEGASVAHTMGRKILGAESFTGAPGENWKQYPGSMKNQGDWAFCIGINRFMYHTFAHNPLGCHYRPGMTMGPYGVHWDRGQTWWPLVEDYHRYISRCSYLLREGTVVADILYLTPEGAPHVFQPPQSAFDGERFLPDKRGYSFDGCSANVLIERAKVVDGCIAFPGGTSYRVLVLPYIDTMTPRLVSKIGALIESGATVVGCPPKKSPSLMDYPDCDRQVQRIVKQIWGTMQVPETLTERSYGKGRIFWGGPLDLQPQKRDAIYPEYQTIGVLLAKMGIKEDFSSDGSLRYIHRRTKEHNIYFVSNRTDQPVSTNCRFRVEHQSPQLWDPITGKIRTLPQFRFENEITIIPMRFEPYESFFVVFAGKQNTEIIGNSMIAENFVKPATIITLEGPWELSFDPNWGGPKQVVFDVLDDWTKRSERGIKYYSGIATYRKSFNFSADMIQGELYLDLGTVYSMARVKLNGNDLGVVWTPPLRVEIAKYLQPGKNLLEIEVANLWPNRLIGDQQEQDRSVRNLKWTSGLLGGREYSTGRYTFTTLNAYSKDSQLFSSGLLGPVKIINIRPLKAGTDGIVVSTDVKPEK